MTNGEGHHKPVLNQESSNVHNFVTAGRPREMHYLPLIQATMTQFGPECENTIFNLT